MLHATPRVWPNLALLGLLLGLSFYTALASQFALLLVQGQWTTIRLGYAHFAGFGLVAACLFCWVRAPRFFRRLLGLTLLLAVVGVVNFLPMAFFAGLTLGGLTLGVEPFMLLLLAGYYFFNRQPAAVFIRHYLLPAPTPQQAAQRQRAAIDQFKRTFARRPDDSLRQLVQERRLVPEALEAARELLHERAAATTS